MRKYVAIIKLANEVINNGQFKTMSLANRINLLLQGKKPGIELRTSVDGEEVRGTLYNYTIEFADGVIAHTSGTSWFIGDKKVASLLDRPDNKIEWLDRAEGFKG